MLWSMGSQTAGHDWVTEQQQQQHNYLTRKPGVVGKDGLCVCVLFLWLSMWILAFLSWGVVWAELESIYNQLTMSPNQMQYFCFHRQ